jgi:hypothetical protein
MRPPRAWQRCWQWAPQPVAPDPRPLSRITKKQGGALRPSNGSPGFGYWLLKLDGVRDQGLADPRDLGRLEYAYYIMAQASGIEMSECRLYEEGPRAHFMTRRFDRTAEGGKLHAQTLCALAHYDYNQPAAYSYEQAFQVMRTLRLPYTAAEQFFRRMVFNVVARNQNDHTKNISFLMDAAGQWQLAPAYDVAYAYQPGNSWTNQHQMALNGKRDNFTRDDLRAVAREMNIFYGISTSVVFYRFLQLTHCATGILKRKPLGKICQPPKYLCCPFFTASCDVPVG